jgi:hypothetical protein
VPGTAPFTVPPGTQAIWWDEFDGDSLDDNKWSYDLGTGDWGWGNNELEARGAVGGRGGARVPAASFGSNRDEG